MKLFTCGPVQMYPSTAIIRSKGFTYFRTKEYGDMVNNILKEISLYLGNTNELATIYLASSGTGAMEAAVENCINKADKSLVINGGGFGKRFCELLDWHEKNYTSIDLNWNEKLTCEHLEKYNDKGYTTLFVNIHETTSGQLYDINLISDFCKKNNMFLIVDAISSFLADEYNMEKYGIDLTIISSQKGLCCSPGCSIISFSDRMKNKIYKNDLKVSSRYFDFKDYFINIERGQTPYTPPVLVMYEIKDMLNIIESHGGIYNWINNIENKSLYFRQKAKKIGCNIPEYPLSNMLTPIFFKDSNAYDVIQILKNKYQIFVNPCGGELASKLLRISHIGNTDVKDIDDLIEKIQLSMDEVKKTKTGGNNDW